MMVILKFDQIVRYPFYVSGRSPCEGLMVGISKAFCHTKLRGQHVYKACYLPTGKMKLEFLESSSSTILEHS